MSLLKRYGYWFGMAAVLAVSLAYSYYGVTVRHFPIAPGDDILVHLRAINDIVHRGVPAFGTSYPPGLYLVVIAFGRLAHLTTLQALTYLAPALLPMAGLAVWLLAWRLHGRAVALVAYALFALVLLQPLQTYYDGSLPNIFAAGILLPLLMFCTVSLIGAWLGRTGWKRLLGWSLAWLLLAAALVYSHHLTVLIFLATLAMWAAVAAVLGLLRTRQLPRILAGLVGVALLFGLALHFFLVLTVFEQARGVLFTFVAYVPHFPFFRSTVSKPMPVWDSFQFGVSFGGVIFQSCCAGLAVLAVRARQLNRTRQLGSLLLACWALIYLIGATHSWSGEPTRLARDLALPGSILAAYFLCETWLFLRKRYRPLAWLLAGLVILLCLPLAQTRIREETDYTPMVRFSTADDQAYAYLLANDLADQTEVFAIQPQMWQDVADSRGDAGRYDIRTLKDYTSPEQKRCILIGWYKDGVWPPAYADQAPALSYLDREEYGVTESFEDPVKELYLACRT